MTLTVMLALFLKYPMDEWGYNSEIHLPASMGYLPLAVSPESMTQSAPSRTALATSEISARVGRGLF